MGASCLTIWCSGTSFVPQILWYRSALFTIKFTPLHWSTDQGVIATLARRFWKKEIFEFGVFSANTPCLAKCIWSGLLVKPAALAFVRASYMVCENIEVTLVFARAIGVILKGGGAIGYWTGIIGQYVIIFGLLYRKINWQTASTLVSFGYG